MARNNPTQDFFNPPSNLSQDFEEMYFSDLNTDELFYQTNKPKETPDAWRKVNENGAMNLKTRQVHNFNDRTKIYQKI